MSQGDHLEFEGVVKEASKGIFTVEISSLQNQGKTLVKCKPAGKLRLHKISLLVGDKVLCEVSPYDLSNGIIKRRL